jgi:Putative prokaryotic signal transducing protein
LRASGTHAGAVTSESKPVVVASVSSRVEAEMIVGMLKSNGVRSLVQADDVAGWDPQLQLINGVRVLVGAADEAKARRLLRDVEKRG